MYFNPTNSIQRWKAVMIYVCVFVQVQKCANFLYLNKNIGEFSIKRCGTEPMQSKTSKEDVLKAKFGL